MFRIGMMFGVIALVSGCDHQVVNPVFKDYPVIDFSSQWIEFGELEYGGSQTRGFVIQNRGDLPLGIDAIYEGKGQDENFEIIWDIANIVCPEGTIEDSGAEAAAKGWSPAPDATINVSTSDVDFGAITPGDSAVEQIVVTNVGADPLTFDGIFITPTDQHFAIVSGGNTDGVVLTTGQEQRIFVEYTPSDALGNQASLFIISNAGNQETVQIPLSGNVDVNPGDSGSDDSGEPTDDTGTPVVPSVLFTLDAGCRIPIDVALTAVDVGEIYGSVIVETKTEEAEEGGTPSFWSDIDHDRSIVYLQGSAVRGEGRIIVTPRSVDFGHIWTGEEQVRYVEVTNAGDGDLALAPPTLDEDCSEGYSINWSYAQEADSTFTLEGGAQTLVEVSFVPSTQDDAYCTLYVNSDDADDPQVPVYLQGNAGVDPQNDPPFVEIRSPDPGYSHNSSLAMEMELNVYDANQPATSLICRVRSAITMNATVANCTPTDESGHVYVSVDMSEYDPGVDALQVYVTDVAGATSVASIPVVINSVFPSSDDDGDGFGSDSTGLREDCDDANVYTYPEAAELFDGRDNDCDHLVDEGTQGADDDGDTFTETVGDCNDDDVDSYPGAPEAADHQDNDCDGTVDEGTNLYDDDGDGYAEVNNDCGGDDDPAINPGAIELCDDIDNDCNGRVDDACLQIDSEPLIVGGINMSATAVEAEQSTQLSVFVYDADGQSPTYTWTLDSDGGAADTLSAAAITWTAPALDGNDGKLFQIYVVVQDPDGHQVWDFAEVAVYPEGTLTEQYTELVTTTESSCATSGAGAGASLALSGLALALLRRRRR